MDILLTDNEVRVLGCLMEKEMATPDYYPLSLNSLINACNQKTNRNPVVSFDEQTVVYALTGLKEQKMARESNSSRVPKYEQIFSKGFNLVVREEAVICALLVRGPQTAGEIRTRTERLFAFDTLDEVKETIISLKDMGLLSKLPRKPGRKEARYTHLLGGEPEETMAEIIPRPESTTVIVRKENDHDGALQDQIDTLRRELQALQEEFVAFKSQFD